MPLRTALSRGVATTLLLSLVLALAACGTPASARPAPPAPYDSRPEVRAFADELAARHGWDTRWVLAQLREARLQPAAQRLIMPAPPGQPKNWNAYRDRFVEPQRIAAGAAFWLANAEALARAEARFGVPAEVIVGIVGVETFYGRIMGRFRALDVLATLAFDFPSGRSDRSAYFREELEHLLALARREDATPASFTGSFAGAIGLPQFMPGSIQRHALDFDGDGHVDLIGSAADAIGSIAHFLAQHGWRPGMPAVFEVTPPADPVQRARLLAPDIVPSFDAATFAAAGAELSPEGRAHDGLMALVSVDNGGDPPAFVAGTVNFFVLTRYNRSSYYARAVLELGAAVHRAVQATTPPAPPAPQAQRMGTANR